MYSYFKSYKDYFWEWEVDTISQKEEGVKYVVTMTNGQSIAYLDTILEILEDISFQGIPPFGAVLLVLIASNEATQEATFTKLKTDFLNTYGSANKTISNAFEVLEYIKGLPSVYKKGATKTELIQLLFKDCHNRLGLKKSEYLIRDINEGFNKMVIKKSETTVSNTVLVKDFKPIALLIRRFKSTEDIIKALQKTPVNNDFTEKIEIEEHLSIENDFIEEDLVTELSIDKKTYQIGSLVKRIWSGLNIPMHNSLPSAQPLGGVSDITNKGDFNRLLISEFAHDDDMFLSRVVNNEALYIERETPPENNTKERIFLIDNSIKNWGIPKVLSFATTLAITSHPKSDFKYRVFVVGETCTEVFLNSKLEVIESQHLLSGSLHCADGIEAFFEEESAFNSQELFFLTEENNLSNTSLQQVINANYNAINYIITNNLRGDLNFYKHQNKSRKHFQHILLPYKEIWISELPKEKKTKDLKSKDLDLKHLLLEPIDKSNAIIIPFGNEIYVIQNKNLYSLTSIGIRKGLQLVFEGISYNRSYQYTIVSTGNDERVLISFSHELRKIERLNLEDKSLIVKDFFNKCLENVIIFTSSSNLVITNKVDFWTIDTSYKLHKLTGKSSYQKSMFNYLETIAKFKNELKKKYINYNVLRNIHSIKLNSYTDNNSFLQISKFILENNKLVYKEASAISYMSAESVIKFIPKTTLYLKRVDDDGKFRLLEYLKKTLKLNVKNIKEIYDTVINNGATILVKDISMEEATFLKKGIEEKGAVCFIKTNYFIANNGSTIHIKNGQLIFNSIKTAIPQFYITSILGFEIAMATEGEFAGNDYFLPVNHKLTTISLKNFYAKYINPFIKQIQEYEG